MKKKPQTPLWKWCLWLQGSTSGRGGGRLRTGAAAGGEDMAGMAAAEEQGEASGALRGAPVCFPRTGTNLQALAELRTELADAVWKREALAAGLLLHPAAQRWGGGMTSREQVRRDASILGSPFPC